MKKFHLDPKYDADSMMYWNDWTGATADYDALVSWATNDLGLTFESLGTSQDGGYTLYGTSVGDETKPTIVIVPNQHGWERGGSHYGAEFMRRLKYNDFTFKKHNQLKHHFHFYFVLSANPWGYANGGRQNSRGVDLNRNYDFHWTSDIANSGDAPLSEAEARIMNDLILEKQPLSVIDIHQYGGGEVMGFSLGGNDRKPIMTSDFCKSLNISDDIPTYEWSANNLATVTNWARSLQSPYGKNVLGLLMETKNAGWDGADSQQLKTYYGINSLLVFCEYLINYQQNNSIILN